MSGAPIPLGPEAGSRLARLALAAVAREYPNKPDHVLDGDAALLPPRALHPAFFGAFDWHSAVHGHWTLARILRLFPSLPEAPAIRATLDASLTPDTIAGELAYLARPTATAFERTYGWAWLLKLAEELRLASRPAWGEAVAPLADAFVERFLAYLPRLSYPIRTGVHQNTAFALAFAHDYSLAARRDDLQRLVQATSLGFFEADSDYPAHLEPGGADFFSPALVEAELMRRILPPERFAAWFARFLPRGPALTPAFVADRADPHLVHLDGLNLSRAWCLASLASALPEHRDALSAGARAHAEASLPHIASGHYAGEHWLATFAVLMLTGA